MKIIKLEVQNVKSFKENTCIEFNKDFNIFVGPNGGGKSNILDIINISLRQYLIFTYKIYERSDGSKVVDAIQRHQSFQNINTALEKFIGDSSESKIIITIEVEKTDIENISILQQERENLKQALTYYGDHWFNLAIEIDKWNLSNLTSGQKLTYTIHNNNLIRPNEETPEFSYLSFLNLFELFIIAARKSGNIKLSPRYIYFSPYRAGSNINLQISLSSENYYELLANYSGITSKQPASLIKIASLYFAEKRRHFEQRATSSGYEKEWHNDEEVKLVSKYLNKLGYNWDLRLQDRNKNVYQIVLEKDGKSFDLEQASSGEKEIINFLIGIFAFNIKDGLVIIDEPEVHLHPRWQILLINLFFDLTKLTGNQFILSTHSSVFINQQTLSSIVRVYRDSDVSRITAINQVNIPTAKDLFHIINSHNNEKIFFADKVVLVEGITDRIFLEKLIRLYQKLFCNKTEVVEVLEVYGKNNLAKYRDFLENISIPNFIIADRDYIENVGNEPMKKLFVVDYQSIDKNVIKHKKSQDGQVLSKELESAIETKDMEKLKNLFDYIISRNKKLKDNLTVQEQESLDKFIQDKAAEKVFMLKSGEIEDYLPEGSKDLDGLIEAVRERKYLDAYVSQSFSNQRQELSTIIFSILNIENTNDENVLLKLKEYQNTPYE